VVLVLAWSYAARDLLPIAPRRPWPAEVQRRAPPLARYDSGWYLRILEQGYGPLPAPGQPSPHVFFPLYPLAARALASLLAIDGFAAGQALSILCFLAAGILFAAEGRSRLGEKGARQALLFLLLYPTSFFLVSMYSESLFLLLALAAFHQARRDRAAAAAVLGLAAGMTRFTAVALALPLAMEAFGAARSPGEPDRASRGALARAAAVGLAPVAGVLLWVFGAGFLAGEPGLYFRVQEAWQRGVSPFVGAWHFAKLPLARIAHGQALENPGLLLDYAHFLLFALIAVWQIRRRRFSDAAWTATALLIPMASGISASLPRYILVVYPAYYAMAEISRGRPRLRLAWWIVSGIFLAVGEAAFVHWRWVA
jgi:mannosyltransferase PIG-V